MILTEAICDRTDVVLMILTFGYLRPKTEVVVMILTSVYDTDVILSGRAISDQTEVVLILKGSCVLVVFKNET